ncbi:MAG: 16S rRNA (cytidine(1402)-2'-O)-methyltransferase [Coriobacteriales bacterium]|nr:16S rRNA (cytidine(1402)-2'-O)-methyltransferase [Coriobacteriales bacterium]
MQNMATDTKTGCLVLIGTPIGNIGDMSERATQALAQAQTVCAEDTRVTSKLLGMLGIKTHVERCDENIMKERIPQLIERLRAGERIAFVSDAGMPAVADPGARLVDACIDNHIPVDVIPGPSAVTCAVAHAGFAGEAFYFGGFLPRKDAERERVLKSLAQLPAVLVFYESPHRLCASLNVIAGVFPLRRVAVARELTKLYQEITRDTAQEVAREFAEREAIKGEIVIVIEPPSDAELLEARKPQTDLETAIKEGLEQGISKTALAKQLARLYNIPRNEAYDRICGMS